MERIICLAIGYAFGLIQTSYLLGRLAHHTDIRDHGSGNAGTTNAYRTFGKKAGAVTLVGDCLKCVLAGVVVRAIFGGSGSDIMPLLVLYSSAGCILGHNFPIYLKMRGGKGIAASVGMLIVFDWKLLLICAVVFFALFFTTHYVSLCSLCGYLVALVCMILFGQMGFYGMDAGHRLELYVVMALLTILAYYRHRANIVRLIHGTESKVYLSGSSKKEDGQDSR